ncbi:uncharacterized protein LOC142312802 [Anomaloglossus baeobatrachus]|uniref:uncharacterized protein LOC142312802 n=1 Tax=Anomaloglossus baeobatrachus TaxID=238106 RepID=UPI003F50CDE2
MSSYVFCTKMILDHGFSRAETLSVQTFLIGIFLVTFATVNACRRYWEAMNAAMPESPFHSFIGSCPIQRGEKRITVSMRNLQTPGRDISTFLRRFCTVVREPSHILNGSGCWTGKWSVTVRLHRELASEDGLQHLPPTFSLENSFGLIYYPDMPHNYRKCGGKRHSMKTCQEDTCRVCWVTGHSSKMNAAMPDSPFNSFIGSCPIQRGEKRITVSMRNPHTPVRDISTFLRRFCTVVREPSHILNGSGFWTGKWSVTIRLYSEPASEDGLQHLPPTFSLGNSFGRIYYPDMPHNCRKCGGKGHLMKTCKEDACRVCRVTGHSSKDCPKKMTCNLCGLAAHLYKNCPQREKSWLNNSFKILVPATNVGFDNPGTFFTQILQGLLGVTRSEVYCLQERGQNTYILTLDFRLACRNFHDLVRIHSNHTLLDDVVCTCLYGGDEVTLVVYMHSSFVTEDDIMLFLRRYCVSVRSTGKVMGKSGLWCRKRRFMVHFNPDPDGVEGFMHPPTLVVIGKEHSYLF